MSEVFSDCRTREGRNIILIDALIGICRVLAEEDLSSTNLQSVLGDFRNDEDVKLIFAEKESSQPVQFIGNTIGNAGITTSILVASSIRNARAYFIAVDEPLTTPTYEPEIVLKKIDFIVPDLESIEPIIKPKNSKKRRQDNEPFYAKFTRKKKDKF